MTMLGAFSGSLVEDAALAWLDVLGHSILDGLAIVSYGVRIGTGARVVSQVAE